MKLAIYILNSDQDPNKDIDLHDIGFDDVIENAVDFIEPEEWINAAKPCVEIENLLRQMIIKLNQGEMSDQDYFYLVDLTNKKILQS